MRYSLLFLLGLGLSACGQGSRAPTPEPVDMDPVSGGTLVIAVDADPVTLNPVLRRTALAGSIIGEISEGLIEMNEQLEFEPGLARRWIWSDDGLQLTYHLHSGLRWSDGEPFSSDDVVATYELFTNDEVPTPWRSNFAQIESVSAPDDTTVVFSFVERSLENLFNSAAFSILPAHVIAAEDPARIEHWEINRAPVSLGPYLVTQWSTNDRLTLERNPAYAGAEPRLERIVFKVVPEEATRLLQLEIGEADMIESVPQKDIARLRDNPDIRLVDMGPRYMGYLTYNLERRGLDDARVRNAISYAIDRRAFVEGLLFGYGQAIANPITPIVGWAYNNDLSPHQRDPDRARALLAAAGWVDTDDDGFVDRDGERLTLEFKTRTGDPVRENGVLVIQSNLRDVGIDVRPRMMELSTVLGQVQDGDFDVYMGQVSGRLSPDLTNIFGTGGGHNWGGYSNERVDALMTEARAAFSRDKAARLWREVQEILYEEQPMTMLYAKSPLVGLRREIRDATPNFLTPYEDLALWWRLPEGEN
jgi:peptide/nickel transport system substrate-binding protein